MNDFRNMWNFEVKDGVNFPQANRVHPLMQKRVQRLLEVLSADSNIRKIVLFGSSLNGISDKLREELQEEDTRKKIMSFLPEDKRQCSEFDLNCYYIMFAKRLKHEEGKKK